MENIDKTPATPESVWEIIRELSLSNRESSARFDKEMAESRAAWKLELAESSAKFDRELAESHAKWNLEMKDLKEMIGGTANSNGMFAEEYFILD